MAVGSNDPIDAPTASKAIAAAEVVAALAGRPAARLPVEIEQWLVGRTRPANALVVAAREAAERILSSSELKALWAESGEHEIWRSEVNGLVGRLFAASAQ
jgi:hypothetical protein